MSFTLCHIKRAWDPVAAVIRMGDLYISRFSHFSLFFESMVWCHGGWGKLQRRNDYGKILFKRKCKVDSCRLDVFCNLTIFKMMFIYIVNTGRSHDFTHYLLFVNWT